MNPPARSPRAKKQSYVAYPPSLVDRDLLDSLNIECGEQPGTGFIVIAKSDWARAQRSMKRDARELVLQDNTQSD